MTELPETTPRKRKFALPNAALKREISAEWRNKKRYEAKSMPLTAIAFAAIDVVAENREKMVNAMLAYAETDLLLYRSETPELLRRQEEAWEPVVAWADARYEIALQVTQGVMPMDQTPQALSTLKRALEACDDFTLAAFSVLTQGLSSCVLALAVLERHLDADAAFAHSRIDEDYQAERWGEDSLGVARAREIQRDVQSAAKFLSLL